MRCLQRHWWCCVQVLHAVPASSCSSSINLHQRYTSPCHQEPPWSVANRGLDAPQTMSAGVNGVGVDPVQAEETYVLERDEGHPCYIIGPKPGPYVAEHSRSIYARLGARVGFFGIDARTERTRHQVNYPETYDVIFDRLNKELSEAVSSGTAIQHLIVLLGIPIAYPVSQHRHPGLFRSY